jgi:hypothetical protein
MQTITLHMRDGDVIFHCAGCARDFYIDTKKPFVPQLRAMSFGHNCSSIGSSSPLDSLL